MAIFILTCLLSQYILSQNKEIKGNHKIGLNGLLKIANKNSLDAFSAINKYQLDYGVYRSFKSSLLPSLSFETDPLTYKSSVVQRYDSQLNQDVYRNVKTLNSSAGLTLSQSILETGGTVSLNSTFNKLTNYTNGVINRFNIVPINISLNQPIWAFNRLKWMDKTANLKYEKAKKELIFHMQSINVKAVDYFFRWLLAQRKKEIAIQKEETAKRLFKIAQKRYKIGSIEKNDLLNLELEVFIARNEVTILSNKMVQTKKELELFLREDLSNYDKPYFEESLLGIKIKKSHALDLYRKNNPTFLDLGIKKIEAERDLDKTIKDNLFDLSLTASYGFNQQSEVFSEAYNDLLKQERIAIRFKIPILDWGERKRNRKMAKRNKQFKDLDLEQEETRLIQDLASKILEFNLQEELIFVAKRASQVAKESYEITEQRFLLGNVDLLRLTSSLKAWQSTNENYISKLSNYWKYYYEIQQLTLFDYKKKRELNIDFEKGILD